MERVESSAPAPGGAERGWAARLEECDRRAMRFLYLRLRNPLFDVVMPVLSVAGNKGILHVVAGAAMMVFGPPAVKRAGVAMLAAAGAAGLLTEVPIKFIWKRKRPFVVMEEIEPKVPHKRLAWRPSFPSGHSAGYFGVASALSVCFPAWAPLFLIVAALGAYSRIYNGLHFPSDVLAGSLIGIVSGFALTPFVLELLGKTF